MHPKGEQDLIIQKEAPPSPSATSHLFSIFIKQKKKIHIYTIFFKPSLQQQTNQWKQPM